MSPAPRVRCLLPTVAVLAGLFFGGCMHPGPQDPARTGPFFTPTNVRGEPSLGGIRRVVVLPVWTGQTAPPETAAEIDPIIRDALQQTRRFEIVSLAREDALRLFRRESFSSAGALPNGLMATLQRDFAADAVLFLDVTVYSAYRPLALGFRAKLASIDGTRLVWAFDDVFAADNASVANSARNFYLDSEKRVPADMTQSAVQSPSRFAAYAATAMFATLPPVLPPPPPRKAPYSLFKP